MYEKYSFANFFIFGFTLAYALGLFLNIWYIRGGGPIYELMIVALQAFTLGVYSIFIENEFINTHSYYQIFIVAMSTSYQVINSLGYFSSWRVYAIAEVSTLVWSLLALKAHDKFPSFLVKVFRYGIGYTIFYRILIFISVYGISNLIASSVLSLGFIFINYLTLEKISFYSSLYLYSHMAALGITTFLAQFYSIYRFVSDPMVFRIVTGIFFVVGLYCDYKKQKSQYILISDCQAAQC